MKNQICGKMLLKESGVGIPDLVVVIFDVDPRTRGGSTPTLALFERGDSSHRLGSVATDQNGAFELWYEDDQFRIRNPEEKRPDVFLAVLAPEEEGKDFKSRILFLSSALRQNAGRVESYRVRLTTEQLEKADVPIPADPNLDSVESDLVVNKVRKFATDNAAIADEVRTIAGVQVAKERVLTKEIDEQFIPLLIDSLTGVETKFKDRFNYVRPDEGPREIEAATFNTINKNIENVINKVAKEAPFVGYVTLTEEQEKTLREDGGIRGRIPAVPADKIEPLLHGVSENKQRTASLTREDPIAVLCREQTLPSPLQDTRTSGEETRTTDRGRLSDRGRTPTPSEPNGDGTATPEDVPKYIDRLMRTMASPEDVLVFGQHPTAEDIQEKNKAFQLRNEGVQGQINAFQLRSGPADVPAFYDFHQLQIAFEHVWQHAVDQGVIDTAKAIYRKIVDNGGNPLEALNSERDPSRARRTDPIRVLRTEWENAHYARTTTNIPGALARLRGPDTHPNGDSGYGEGEPRPQPPPPPPPLPPPSHPWNINLSDHMGAATDVYDPSIHQPNRTLLDELEDRLKAKNYAFTVYAPNSTNFGILVTYRQKWEPISYQVGQLISTIPLMPGEKRTVIKKKVFKKKRLIKEMENNLRIHKEDSSDTTRAEAEIVQRAEAKTNFTQTSQGTFKIGIAEFGGTTSFGKDASTASQESKKSFREAVFKAAQEFKDERKIEIETEEVAETEETETGEIRNTNDEIPVTFLYYELQRRYRVSEQIHRVTPVVLVALEVPRPDQITLGWLAQYDWILNRVLLDDSLRAPLMYLRQIVGDEHALDVQRVHVDKLREVTTQIKDELVSVRATVGRRYAALAKSIEKRADVVAGEATEGFLGGAKDFFFGSSDEESVEAVRIREDAARDAAERAAKEEKELEARLEREVTALQVAMDAYTKAKSEHLNHKTEVARLRVHIMLNIFHYMQGIWNHTHPDQLFFQLHTVKVPRLLPKTKTYRLTPVPDSRIPASVTPRPGQKVFEVRLNLELDPSPLPDDDFATLAEVADLDNPLGFKGNYLILPLKESNALTDFMMLPYIDDELGLHDPDEFGNWTLSSFAEYVKCLKEHMTANDFEAIKDQLVEQYKRLLTAPRREDEEIIVPTDSLYIEALPGTHPVLEDFKLLHRAMDVLKVKEDVREAGLENIRGAARLLAGEREDPDIEKKIVIEGDAQRTVDVGSDT